MKNLSNVKQALLNIFKVSLQDSTLEELIRTCHFELVQLLGEDKVKNFYVAIYVGESNYLFPFFVDEQDYENNSSETINLKGALTDYIRKSRKTELINRQSFNKLMEERKIERLVGTMANEWLGAPIMLKDHFTGVLAIQTYDDSIHYTPEDVEIVNFVTNNIALLIDRINKDRELQEYRENLEKKVQEKSNEILGKNAKLKKEIEKVKRSEKIQKVLFNISEAKSKARDLKDLLIQIHNQVRTLMPAINFYVAIVVDREKGLYRLPYMCDENPGEILNPDQIQDISKGLTHYVLKREKPLLVNRKKLLSVTQKNSDMAFIGKLAQSWMGIPLRTNRGEILGVVAVQSYSNPVAYNLQDQKILSIISTSIADAVKYKQLEEEKIILEEKLLESKKMEAVGILASGIAHEFNNLLSIIMGYAYTGLSESAMGSADYKRYDKIEKTSERAADLVEKLMIFAQKRDSNKNFISDIAIPVQEAYLIAQNHTTPNVRLLLEIREPLWPIIIDKSGIDEIMSNIIDNAIKAVSQVENGVVKISVDNLSSDSPYPSFLRQHEKYIYIKVEDNGHGMDENTRAQIFNPFFTTREPGKGTGLGLAIVYTLIKENNGFIDVESELNKGTIFHIYLPTSTN